RAAASAALLPAQQQADHARAGAHDGERRWCPEGEHPLEAGLDAREFGLELRPELRQLPLELGVELPQTSLEFCIELRPAGAPLRVKLREALLQLRVEPTEVQLVQLAQISAIGRVYIVEPGHELGSDLLAQDLVEPLGQF